MSSTDLVLSVIATVVHETTAANNLLILLLFAIKGRISEKSTF